MTKKTGKVKTTGKTVSKNSVAKATKSKTKKTAGKVSAVKKAVVSKTKVKKPIAKKSTTKKATAKKVGVSSVNRKTTKKTTTTKTKTTKTKSNINAFLANVAKQATKAQKDAQTEIKVWIKKLNTQDKELSQLTKKMSVAQGTARASLSKKVDKLQSEMSATRTGLLTAENTTDKIATLVEWVKQLDGTPVAVTYKPTLVSNKNNSYEQDPEEMSEEEHFMFDNDNDDDLDEEATTTRKR